MSTKTRVVKTVHLHPDLNDDDEHRINIIGLEGNYSHGGTEKFSSLSGVQLRELLDNGFMKVDDRHNNSPTNGEILEFLTSHPDFRAGGYAVSPERPDYRISIDQVGLNLGLDLVLDRSPTQQEIIDFVKVFRYADEFGCDSEQCFAWYD